MAIPSDVLAFRAAGHSVAEMMAHLSISERTVYNASARARRESVSISVDLPSASPAPIPADDLAGDNTWWRCPVLGDLIPAVSGSRRHVWMAERRRVFARPVELNAPDPASPAEVDLPDPASPAEVDLPDPASPAEVDIPAPAPAPLSPLDVDAHAPVSVALPGVKESWGHLLSI